MPTPKRLCIALFSALITASLLGACSSESESHSELYDSQRQHLDKAEAVQKMVDEQAQRQRELIDAQTGSQDNK